MRRSRWCGWGRERAAGAGEAARDPAGDGCARRPDPAGADDPGGRAVGGGCRERPGGRGSKGRRANWTVGGSTRGSLASASGLPGCSRALADAAASALDAPSPAAPPRGTLVPPPRTTRHQGEDGWAVASLAPREGGEGPRELGGDLVDCGRRRRSRRPFLPAAPPPRNARPPTPDDRDIKEKTGGRRRPLPPARGGEGPRELGGDLVDRRPSPPARGERNRGSQGVILSSLIRPPKESPACRPACRSGRRGARGGRRRRGRRRRGCGGRRA